MWRSFFIALGIYGCLLGAQCLVVDRVALTKKESVPASFPGSEPTLKNKELVLPEWAPWSLMSTGAVTLIYSFTLRRSG